MVIDHIALWVRDLQKMVSFYTSVFTMTAGPIYHNDNTHFSSCFLSFASGPRLELMHLPDIATLSPPVTAPGYAHLAIALGSRPAVDRLTEKMRKAGYTIAGEPRVTGDGYYESVVLDPEGNRIELTV